MDRNAGFNEGHPATEPSLRGEFDVGRTEDERRGLLVHPHPFDQFVEQGVTEADIVTQATVDAVEIDMEAVAESRSEFGRSSFLCHDTRATLTGPDPPRDYSGRLPSETLKARAADR